ncbi:MAG: hypothetical protein K6A73_04390 [Bacteroidales bacterium]|nr:hypothetical protein [Bacteroidales bacterium]
MKAFYPTDIREEELKNKVANDWFADYDTTRIIGNIDFCVAVPDKNTLFHEETESIVWAESKPGTNHDIYHSFVQLLLTIGKARTFEKYLPPQYIGAFDCARFAFIPYHAIQDIFYQNDFNWNVTPSDHNSKEFIQLKEMVEKSLHDNAYIYNFAEEERTLRQFIKQNIVLGNRKTKRHKVSKNNFTFVYQRWCSEVKPSIAVKWDNVKKAGLLDADFFLADLLSKDGNYLLDNLYVLLKHDHYQFDRSIDDNGLFSSKEATFNDEMKAHISFWNKYERPPRREYWNYIVERRDLLVPQDVRERKGSFFTPQKWVELSQEYLEMELGENWQDEYYIWDCCAGTGNLLAGLTNKYRIWASTLDKADVAVMHERIRNGANLLESHVFQFDFLNDDFNKLPQGLQDIINDPNERKKLVIYINPPYAEASNARTSSGTGSNRSGLSDTNIKAKYINELGRAANELFAQFFARIVKEIPSSVLAIFSTLKILQAPNFSEFRKTFRAKPGRIFLVPANTFDNVTGSFPIGFQIWQTDTEDFFEEANADVYDSKGCFFTSKHIFSNDNCRYIIEWLRNYYDKTSEHYAYIRFLGTDFQNNKGVFLTLSPSSNDLKQVKGTWVTYKNILPCCIYFSVRHCIESTWLNDRDQFLYPNDGWEKDKEFQADCLVYALFHSQNRISSQHGTNNWIPFTEEEVNAPDCFSSHFMSDFIAGKDVQKSSDKECVQGDLFENQQIISDNNTCIKDSMSQEAIAVMDIGRNIWSYYMMQNGINVNASFYDIKEYFKGRDEKGRMNASSDDECFNAMTDELRVKLNNLAKKIEAKVYEYGFLKA